MNTTQIHTPGSKAPRVPSTLRDDEIIVGEAYLKLLMMLNQEHQFYGNNPFEDTDDSEDSDEEDSLKPKVLCQELIDIEFDKASWLIDELTKSGYLVDTWIEDPDGEDGGFWTSRLPQIGDIVQVPRDFKIDWESQEPCEDRADTDVRISTTNRPDSNPYSPLGWEEDPIWLRITLNDILEASFKLTDSKPKTLAAIELLQQWGELQFSPSLRRWAKRLDKKPLDLFIEIAKDSRLLHPRFTKTWHYAWACDQVYTTYETKYNRVAGDQSMLWIKAVRDLMEMPV